MGRPAPITCYPVLAPPPPRCECTEEVPEKHHAAPAEVECAEKMPVSCGEGVRGCCQMESKFSRSWTRTSASVPGHTEAVADMAMGRVGCVRDCHPTRDQLTERRDVNVCLPPPRPVEIPANQPKFDLHFDPNPFRGKCDGRVIRCDDRPAKVVISDPPPLVSLFPRELRLGAPPNFWGNCPPVEDKRDCEPDLPRRPLSPDGFKYPTMMTGRENARENQVTQHDYQVTQQNSYDARPPNPCSTPIQQTFQRTRYPATLEIEYGVAPFPIHGPPPLERNNDDCDCRDINTGMDYSTYPESLRIDYGTMNFPLNGPPEYAKENRGQCNGQESENRGRNEEVYYEPSARRDEEYPGGGNNGICVQDRTTTMGGSAVAEEYQRMCRDMNNDFCFGGQCDGDREPNHQQRDRGEKDFFCYRAEVEYEPQAPSEFGCSTTCDCGPFRWENSRVPRKTTW